MAASVKVPLDKVRYRDLVSVFRKKYKNPAQEVVDCVLLITPHLLPLCGLQLDILKESIRRFKVLYKDKTKKCHRKAAQIDAKFRDWLDTPFKVDKEWISYRTEMDFEKESQRQEKMEKLWEDLSRKRQQRKSCLIHFYYIPGSTSSKAVMMAAEAIGIKLMHNPIHLEKKDRTNAEIRKINPQQRYPIIKDTGFVLNESQAIIRYLANTYAKTDSMYPMKSLRKRATVDSRMEFEQSTLTPQFYKTFPEFESGSFEPIAENLEKLAEALGVLDEFVINGFVAGFQPTIADFCTMATLDAVEETKYNLSKFQNIQRYIKTCKNEFKVYKKAREADAPVIMDFNEPTVNEAPAVYYHEEPAVYYHEEPAVYYHEEPAVDEEFQIDEKLASEVQPSVDDEVPMDILKLEKPAIMVLNT